MIGKVVRRIFSHRPTDTGAVAGSRLARCNSPQEILQIAEEAGLAASTKIFALRRLGACLSKGVQLASEDVKKTKELVEHVAPSIPTASDQDVQHLLFCFRTVRDSSSQLWAALPTTIKESLRSRTLALVATHSMRGHILLSAFYEFARLDWNVNPVIPNVCTVLENENELVSWEQIMCVVSAIDNIRSPSMERVVDAANGRIAATAMHRAELPTLVAIYKRVRILSRYLPQTNSDQICDRCYEAIVPRLSTADISVLSHEILDFVFTPHYVSPLIPFVHSAILNLLQSSPLSNKTACDLVIYCSKMQKMGFFFPKELLEAAIKSLPKAIAAASTSDMNNVTFALWSLGVPIDEHLGTALVSTGQELPADVWTVALGLIYPAGKGSEKKLVDAARNTDLRGKLRIVGMLATQLDASSQSLRLSLEAFLLQLAKSNTGSALLSPLISIESKADFFLGSDLRSLCAQLLDLFFAKKWPKSDSFSILQVLVNCYDSHPTKASSVLRYMSAEFLSGRTFLTHTTVPFTYKLSNLVNVLSLLPPKLTAEMLAAPFKIGEIGRDSYCGEQYRKLLNMNADSFLHSCAATQFHDPIFEAALSRPAQSHHFLHHLQCLFRSPSTQDEAYYKVAKHIFKQFPKIHPHIRRALSEAPPPQSINLNPAVFVKLSEGRGARFDSDLLDLSINCTKYQLRDKIVAVYARRKEELIQEFNSKLQKLIEVLPINFVGRVLDLLPVEKNIAEARKALVTHIGGRMVTEQVNTGTTLAVLRTMRELSYADANLFSLCVRFLPSSSNFLTPDSAVSLIGILGDFGKAIDPMVLKHTLSTTAKYCEDMLPLGKFMCAALHKANCVENEDARLFLSKYWAEIRKKGEAEVVLPSMSIIPLIRSGVLSPSDNSSLENLLSRRSSELIGTFRFVSYLLTPQSCDFSASAKSLFSEIRAENSELVSKLAKGNTESVEIPVSEEHLGLLSKKAMGNLAFIEEIYAKENKIVIFAPKTEE